MRPKLKTALIWLVLLASCLLLLQLTTGGQKLPYEGFDRLVADLDEGAISSIRIDSNRIEVSRWRGHDYQTLGVVDDELLRRLSEAGVVVHYGEASDGPLRTLLVVGLPLLLLLAAFVYFLRKGSQGGNIMSLKKSRARKIADSQVTFADVGGCEDAKQQLGDLIDFLRQPERWSRAGVRLPRGVLLEGPPGCGKTLLARAVAGETDASFFLVSASEFVEMFVGVGAARVRDLFETAARAAPAVIFIDEIDAVGRRRGSGVGLAHDEREQTLNQMLACMDGFEQNDRVVVIGATNRADVLDPALLRPGRFDRRIEVPALDREQRIAVLRIHTRSKKLGDDVSLEAIAERSAGWSGARLEALANEAGLLAVRRAREAGEDETVLCAEDFERAMRPAQARGSRFDRVDSLIIESTTQLSQATGPALVRIHLMEGTVIEGELSWADASFLKLRGADGSSRMVPKSMVKTLEALEGTEAADAADLSPDRWAGARPEPD